MINFSYLECTPVFEVHIWYFIKSVCSKMIIGKLPPCCNCREVYLSYHQSIYSIYSRTQRVCDILFQCRKFNHISNSQSYTQLMGRIKQSNLFQNMTPAMIESLVFSLHATGTVSPFLNFPFHIYQYSLAMQFPQHLCALLSLFEVILVLQI